MSKNRLSYSDYLGAIEDETGYSYHLDTCGDTMDDLLDNATISLVDNDGGDKVIGGIWDAPSDVEDEALSIIQALWTERPWANNGYYSDDHEINKKEK